MRVGMDAPGAPGLLLSFTGAGRPSQVTRNRARVESSPRIAWLGTTWRQLAFDSGGERRRAECPLGVRRDHRLRVGAPREPDCLRVDPPFGPPAGAAQVMQQVIPDVRLVGRKIEPSVLAAGQHCTIGVKQSLVQPGEVLGPQQQIVVLQVVETDLFTVEDQQTLVVEPAEVLTGAVGCAAAQLPPVPDDGGHRDGGVRRVHRQAVVGLSKFLRQRLGRGLQRLERVGVRMAAEGVAAAIQRRRAMPPIGAAAASATPNTTRAVAARTRSASGGNSSTTVPVIPASRPRAADSESTATEWTRAPTAVSTDGSRLVNSTRPRRPVTLNASAASTVHTSSTISRHCLSTSAARNASAASCMVLAACVPLPIRRSRSSFAATTSARSPSVTQKMPSGKKPAVSGSSATSAASTLLPMPPCPARPTPGIPPVT